MQPVLRRFGTICEQIQQLNPNITRFEIKSFADTINEEAQICFNDELDVIIRRVSNEQFRRMSEQIYRDIYDLSCHVNQSQLNRQEVLAILQRFGIFCSDPFKKTSSIHTLVDQFLQKNHTNIDYPNLTPEALIEDYEPEVYYKPVLKERPAQIINQFLQNNNNNNNNNNQVSHSASESSYNIGLEAARTLTEEYVKAINFSMAAAGIQGHLSYLLNLIVTACNDQGMSSEEFEDELTAFFLSITDEAPKYIPSCMGLYQLLRPLNEYERVKINLRQIIQEAIGQQTSQSNNHCASNPTLSVSSSQTHQQEPISSSSLKRTSEQQEFVESKRNKTEEGLLPWIDICWAFCQSNRAELVNLLTPYFGNEEVLNSTEPHCGLNLVQYAILHNRPWAISLLANCGASIVARTAKGRTLLEEVEHIRTELGKSETEYLELLHELFKNGVFPTTEWLVAKIPFLLTQILLAQKKPGPDILQKLGPDILNTLIERGALINFHLHLTDPDEKQLFLQILKMVQFPLLFNFRLNGMPVYPISDDSLPIASPVELKAAIAMLKVQSPQEVFTFSVAYFYAILGNVRKLDFNQDRATLLDITESLDLLYQSFAPQLGTMSLKLLSTAQFWKERIKNTTQHLSKPLGTETEKWVDQVLTFHELNKWCHAIQIKIIESLKPIL